MFATQNVNRRLHYSNDGNGKLPRHNGEGVVKENTFRDAGPALLFITLLSTRTSSANNRMLRFLRPSVCAFCAVGQAKCALYWTVYAAACFPEASQQSHQNSHWYAPASATLCNQQHCSFSIHQRTNIWDADCVVFVHRTRWKERKRCQQFLYIVLHYWR